MTKNAIIESISVILRQYPVKKAALFGSYARGEQTEDSDVDVLLEFDLTNELPDVIFEVWDRLEMMGRRFDLMTFDNLNLTPNEVKDSILRDMEVFHFTRC